MKNKKNIKKLTKLFFLFLAIIPAGAYLFSQFPPVPPPKTVLPEELLKAILNEVSGQLAFNNEIAVSGYNKIRTAEEYQGVFHEAEFLAAKLKEYGIDEVDIETYSVDPRGRGSWWNGDNAELWLVSPEKIRLSRLSEHPALMALGCDQGEWEAEAIYLDRRDLPPHTKDIPEEKVKGKIIVTPEYASYFCPDLEKGALGIITADSPAKPFYDPFAVGFDMDFHKGKAKHKLFVFKVWPLLVEQLRDRIFSGEKVILRAWTKTSFYPMKEDTILATIKGTAPEKKGIMFTAHLFERPFKQGANDNASGSVTLVEIARTITALIRDGVIPRPERNIHFLIGEEGTSLKGYFQKHPEKAKTLFAALNFDMVGENLEKNFAFFNIERSPFSKPTFIDSAAINAARYVFETNIERHRQFSRKGYVDFPVPIVEKNGTKQPFRFTTCEHEGGSDNQIFADSDSNIPVLSFNCWPDLWYHTDKDRPDKSDPTQLKRAAFIGILSALSCCSGDEAILENLIRISYQEKRELIQNVITNAIEEISKLKEADGGAAFGNARNDITQAVKTYQAALSGIGELTRGNAGLDAFLSRTIQGLDIVEKAGLAQLEKYYKSVAALRNFKPETAKITAEEKELEKIIPAKIAPLTLGFRLAHQDISVIMRKNGQIVKMFRKYSFNFFEEIYLSIDGKRSMADIRNFVSYVFKPVPADDFMRMMNSFKEAGLIKY